jgi:paraquat-inducible protein A
MIEHAKQIACHECDLLVKLSNLSDGHKAICPRCGYALSSQHINAIERVIAFSISALVFLFLSFMFPFLTFSAQGQERTVTLMQTITVMIADGFTSLAVIVFSSIIVIPLLYLVSIAYSYVSLFRSKLLFGTRGCLKIVGRLKHWSMAEIFLIGIMVSFIKIMSLAEVNLGLSFWSFVLFVFNMTAAVLHIDNHQAWQRFREKKGQPVEPILKDNGHKGCHVCTNANDESKNSCDICGSHLHKRIQNSVETTWALLITSVMLYFPANMLPIMRTNFLGEETANTILGGVVVLWEHGSYPIALIIFVASVLVPVGKIVTLGWLCFNVQTQNKKSLPQKMQFYRATEIVGRWSMVDVFVVAILVALIKLGNIMSIYPGWGAVAFAVMVIFTVMAALSFDPRLFWDPVQQEHNR